MCFVLFITYDIFSFYIKNNRIYSLKQDIFFYYRRENIEKSFLFIKILHSRFITGKYNEK